MVDLFIVLNSVHNQQNQYFISILESIQDYQYFLIREDSIHQKVHPFTFFHHDRIFVGRQNEN